MGNEDQALVLAEKRDGIAVVTINRPKALNALNTEVLRCIKEIFTALDNDKEVRAIVLTGCGQKAFAAGADIAEMKDMGVQEAEAFSRLGHSTMDAVEHCSKFVIAAVNGYALGGGCELSLACDVRLAAPNARFGIPETTLGLIPGFGGTQRLPRLVGLGAAKEMMATGRQVKAEEALRIGLVNKVCEEGTLLEQAVELAKAAAKNSVSAIALGKRAMNDGVEMDIHRAMDYEAALFGEIFATPDAKEGTTAFVEKRKAAFE